MFKTFPEFSKLTLADKNAYEELVRGYPPVGNISFAGLMTWHNTFDQMRVAVLNDNLVLPYWLPGDEKNSGLALVGTSKVDESLCTIFDHLKSKGENVRLVNVPDFVVAHIRYPEMFTFKPMRMNDEYIVAVEKFYPLDNISSPRRHRIERTLSKVGEVNIDARSLRLESPEDRDFLLDAVAGWQAKNINNYGKLEYEALGICIKQAKDLGLSNVCIFVNGNLRGFCIYELSSDGKYATMLGIKATHKNLLGFELIGYMLAKWFAEHGVEFVNLNSDMGLLRLRMFMLTLGPVNFFRKYLVEPM